MGSVLLVCVFSVVLLAMFFDGKMALKNKDIEIAKIQKEIEAIRAKTTLDV